MSQSDLEDGDRDPRRVRKPSKDPLFIPELPLDEPKVADPIRFRMPYNYGSKSKKIWDNTDQTTGSKFTRKKNGKFGSAGDVQSASFNLRDDKPTGTIVAESYGHKRLRYNSYSHMLRGEGVRHSCQFREWGYNRDIQNRRQNIEPQEKSHSNFSNNFSPRFSPQNFSPQFRSPYPRHKPNPFSKFQNRTPNKNLTKHLKHHHTEWLASGEYRDYLDIRNAPQNLRDDLYREKVREQSNSTTVLERHLHTPRPTLNLRGRPSENVSRPFRPYLWYDWRCKKYDDKPFNVAIDSRSGNPRKKMWVGCLSTPVKPKIEVTGWRRRIDEVGF